MGFFSRPDKFSFKDLLAIAVVGAFLYFAFLAVRNIDALQLVETLIPVVSIVLGGYFVHEAAAMYRRDSTKEEEHGEI